MTLEGYLRKYGIIGPYRSRAIRRREVSWPDLEGLNDCD